ncbi:Helix-turn-helix domain-containing protein [Halovenus aranensis]|uniref:Helix-turn-helix domain-containing protein n=1 Tax=Halovenus aranensis TaxID=890420 RepID=A0A1G8T0V1_9EURY|nr:helix-turn-helix domain-containing protein [Halovenus aranensis]SDJ34645.1 Helix-turn-helix domain-containing protein [Halovenus aranensis]
MTGNKSEGNDPGPSYVEDELSPEAAFELAAHETRIAVLQTLQAANGGPLSFGEIRERVGVDDPGQCHYHVDKLCDRFVRKTDRGYTLTPAGWQLMGALLSGSVTSSIPEEAVDAGGACSECGGGLSAYFRKSGVTIACTACKSVQTDPDIPPAMFEDWPLEDLPEVVGRHTRRMELDAAHGFCPNCRGRVSRGVVTPADEAAPDWFDGQETDAIVLTDCQRCGRWWHAVPSIAALAEPAVIALHHDHGIDLRERPWWTLDHLAVGDVALTSNPTRVRIPIALGDGWTVVFDDAFDFVETRQTER